MFFLSISSSLSICSAEVFPEAAKKYGTQVCYMYVKEIAGLENFFNMFALGYSYLISTMSMHSKGHVGKVTYFVKHKR